MLFAPCARAGGFAAPDGNTICGSAAPVSSRDQSHAASTSDRELLDLDVLKDRNRAFELFRKSYRKNEAIEDNKQVLREKYAQAKALGEQVNRYKARIGALKLLIEQRRVQRSAADIAAGGAGVPGDGMVDQGEEDAKAEIEEAKQRYKGAFDQLRASKKEIEHLQLLLEQSRKRMTKDFGDWFEMMTRQLASASSQPAHDSAHAPGPPESDWPTTTSQSAASSLRAASVSTASSRHIPLQAWAADAPHTSQAGGPLAGGRSVEPGPHESPADRRRHHIAPADTSAWTGSSIGAIHASGSSEPAVGDVRGARGPKLRSHALQMSIDGNDGGADVLQAPVRLLTGDARADRDIIGFYAARNRLLGQQ